MFESFDITQILRAQPSRRRMLLAQQNREMCFAAAPRTVDRGPYAALNVARKRGECLRHICRIPFPLPTLIRAGSLSCGRGADEVRNASDHQEPDVRTALCY